jgi:hypothetical protein
MIHAAKELCGRAPYPFQPYRSGQYAPATTRLYMLLHDFDDPASKAVDANELLKRVQASCPGQTWVLLPINSLPADKQNLQVTTPVVCLYRLPV